MPAVPRPYLKVAAVAFAVFALAFLYYAARPINHDTGWFMYAARGMLAGGTLYRDFIDVNAPMAYCSMLPAAWLSTLPFFSNEAALTLSILIYILVAYILCVAVMRRMNLPARMQTLLPIALLIMMCFMPHYAFGQREHIFAVLLMPYALAAAVRSENKALPRGLAIACGIAAGLGASVKPPFLIVPVFIEAAVLLRQRTWKLGFTYDVLALAGSTAVIYLVSYLLYPHYWQDILPSAVALYEPYNNFQFLSDALFLQAPLFFIGFIAGDYRGRGPIIATRWMLAATTIGAFALFILQRKGWPHHALPILMFMSALFVFNLSDLKTRTVRDRKNAWLRGGITAVAITCAFYLAYFGGNVNPDMQAGVEERLQDTDGSFYIMSTGNYPAFPIALNPKYKWTSRFPQLIMLPGLIKAELDGAPSPYAQDFHAAVLEDIQREKPSTIFLYTDTDAGGVDGNMMMQWFQEDPAFVDEWRHYHWTGSAGVFAVFRRE